MRLKKIISMLIAFVMMFSVIPTSIAASIADDMVSFELFYDFEDYKTETPIRISSEQTLPDSLWEIVGTSSQRGSFGSYTENNNTAMLLGSYSSPTLWFDRYVDSGILHISYDFKLSHGGMTFQTKFQDKWGMNESPRDYGANNWSFATTIEGAGKDSEEPAQIKYFAVKSDETNKQDMNSYNYITSDLTVTTGEYHRFDMITTELSQDLPTANFYIDGVLVNRMPVGTGSGEGFRSVSLSAKAVDNTTAQPLTENVLVDNLSVSRFYDDLALRGNIVGKSGVDAYNGEIAVRLSEQVDDSLLTKENVTITGENGAIYNFSVTDVTKTSFKVKFAGGVSAGEYKLSLSSGILGKASGKALGKPIEFNVKTKEESLQILREDFDSYKSTEELNLAWASNGEGVLLNNVGYKGNNLKITPNRSVAITAQNSFEKVDITEDICVEMFTKYSIGWELGIKSGDSYHKILDADTDGNIKVNSQNTGVNLSKGKWEKLKITFKPNGKLVISDSDTSAEFDYSGFNSFDGLKYQVSKSEVSAYSLNIDSIKIFKKQDADTVSSLSFKNNELLIGASMYTQAEKNENGYVLYGRDETSLNHLKACLLLDIDKDLSNVDKFENIKVRVSYLDEGYGHFFLKYNTPSGEKYSEEVATFDEGGEKTYEFNLTDVIFNSNLQHNDVDAEGNGTITKIYSDIDICTTTNTYKTNMSYVAKYNYTKEPVCITKVEILRDNTYSPIDISHETESAGNIFYDYNMPEFNISFTDLSDEGASFKAEYNIYEYDKDMNPVLKQSGEKEYYGTSSEKVSYNAEKFGLYALELTLEGNVGDKVISQREWIDFSKCVGNDNLDYKMGVGSHLIRNTDIPMEQALTIMTKGGFGLSRDDTSWDEYEKEKGVYELTDRQEEYFDLMAKYKLEPIIILSDSNALYDSDHNAFPSDDTLTSAYGNYVKNLLSEPKVSAVCSMIEAINEPDILMKHNKTPQSVKIYTNTAEQNEERGRIYANILKTTNQVVQEINTKKNEDYKLGGFSLCMIWTHNDPIKSPYLRFAEGALDELDGEQAFDALTLHPYGGPTDDPEIGEDGRENPNYSSSILYKIRRMRGLFTGETFINPTTGEESVANDSVSGQRYNYEIPGIWHTEFGYSSAKYKTGDSQSMCTGDDFKQAELLLRGINIIKSDNLSDKVWIYDLIDDGMRENEEQFNYGIINSKNHTTPYSAKYAYLAMSNFNKMIDGATDSKEEYSNNYCFVSEYDCGVRDVHLMWTSNPDGAELTYDFGEKCYYYDIFGNKLDEADVKADGKYSLTMTPFYVVCGEDIKRQTSDFEYKITDGIFDITEKPLSQIDVKNIELKLENGEMRESAYTLMGALYKGERLVKAVTMPSPAKADNGIDTINVSFDGVNISDYDKLKFFVWEDISKLKPLQRDFEK